MNLKYTAIPLFFDSLYKLTKKVKDGHKHCPDDIERTLANLSFAEIIEVKQDITQNRDFLLKKIRIPKSGTGKSNGYRIYIILSLRVKVVCLLDIFYKKGSVGANDLTDQRIKDLVNEFNELKQSDSLNYSNLYDCLHQINSEV